MTTMLDEYLAAVIVNGCSAAPGTSELTELAARGKYLFDHAAGCIDCHSTRDWTKYGGPVVPGTTGKGGDLYGTR